MFRSARRGPKRFFSETPSVIKRKMKGGHIFDEINHHFPFETQGVEHHLIVTRAAAGIAGGEFAMAFERDFEPKTRQVQHAERAGHA